MENKRIILLKLQNDFQHTWGKIDDIVDWMILLDFLKQFTDKPNYMAIYGFIYYAEPIIK